MTATSHTNYLHRLGIPMIGIGFFELLIVGVLGLGCLAAVITVVVLMARGSDREKDN